MYPSSEHPAYGSFVRDQVEALKRLPDLELEVFTFPGGSVSSYARAGLELRRRYDGRQFDVVHAHFGLTIWPTLAVRGARHVATLHGTDLSHPRSRRITLAGSRFVDLVATVSEGLARQLPRRRRARGVAVLPCGVDTSRFHPIPRREARTALGLDLEARYLLFPSDPRRPEKRYDLARAVAGEVPLLCLRAVDPYQVPLWVNAADAVVIPSDREGFGLGVLEALACDVPVLATPVGIAPEVLENLTGAHCGPFDLQAWRAAVEDVLADPDPRLEGRARAERFSAERMAVRVLEAWQTVV